MHATKNPFTRFKTQDEVDAQIDVYIRLAHNAEARRDKEVWESPRYWALHDIAIKWHEKARALMPKGS